ncbi:MAG: hypothetical protein JNK45_37920 [Myxococcales bacterium]|nr:hypothetical protein [Myxococcales bacterium]
MRMRVLGPVSSLRIALVLAALPIGCAGGTDLAVTTFGDATGTGGLGEGSATTTASDASGTADTTAGGATDSAGSTTDPDPSSTTGDDCLAEELCDGLDNTCDGDVDEGCECEPLDTQGCYSGPEGTDGLGMCTAGTQACTVDGAWGACDGEITPIDEVCDGADNDCDDEVDEGFDTAVCGEGICQVTVETCTEGVPQRCIPGEPDDSESCNGTDDDCDGDIDEGCTCNDGEQQPCYAGPMGTQGIGLCVAGVQNCANGSWGSCEGDVVPTAEACDGLDNDCDMAADEGNPGGGAACGTGLAGVCSVGHQQCNNAVLSCVQDNQPSGEVCDGLDNDCDTGTDEGNPGGGGACNTGLAGVCSAGTNQCMGGALQCVQNVQASMEVCDAVDNDCDGSNNEGNPGGGQACNTGLPGVCAPGTTSCAGGIASCNQTTQASAEICDGLDNDCDTGTDEGNPGGGGACNTGLLGACATGATTCSGGALGCTQTVFAGGEVCGNGIDEDCDGAPDDGCGCAHSECVAGVLLAADCSGCAAEVCAVDAFCCATSWDGICVNEAAIMCAAPLCSACAHSPCDAGGFLVSGCDAGFSNCVASVCAADPFCCNSSWDGVCVGEVASVCGLTC